MARVSSPYPVVINCRDRVAPLKKLVGWLERHGHQRIVLVDNASSDVVPESFCPGGVLDLLREILDRYPEHCKAGPGLRIDNLPRWSSHRREIMRWERQFWESPIAAVPDGWPTLYEAPIDTTFAMYRPSAEPLLDKAIRTGFPYVARHEPWYSNAWRPSREDRYYRAHARPDVTSLDLPELPERIQTLVASQPELSRKQKSWLKSLKSS